MEASLLVQLTAPPDSTVAAPLRILIVDDHGVVREGLAFLLEKASGMKVVGFAATGEDAVNAAARLTPDLIIMDLVLPILSGIDATKRILADRPQSIVIALSACHTPEHVHRAFRSGARGYVAKSAAGAELLHAVRRVIGGGTYVSPGIIATRTDDGFAGAVPMSPFEQLSRREREVLRCVVAGSTSVEIAQQLSLSAKTVDTYRGRLMVKLGVHNRSQLIRFAIASDLTSV